MISLGNSGFSIYDQNVLQPKREAANRHERDVSSFQDLMAQIGAISADAQQRLAAAPDNATRFQIQFAAIGRANPLIERVLVLYPKVGEQLRSLELSALSNYVMGTFGVARAMPIMERATSVALREKNLVVANSMLAIRARIALQQGDTAKAWRLMDQGVHILAGSGEPTIKLWHAEALGTYGVFKAIAGDCATARTLIGRYRAELAPLNIDREVHLNFARMAKNDLGSRDSCEVVPLLEAAADPATTDVNAPPAALPNATPAPAGAPG